MPGCHGGRLAKAIWAPKESMYGIFLYLPDIPGSLWENYFIHLDWYETNSIHIWYIYLLIYHKKSTVRPMGIPIGQGSWRNLFTLYTTPKTNKNNSPHKGVAFEQKGNRFPTTSFFPERLNATLVVEPTPLKNMNVKMGIFPN